MEYKKFGSVYAVRMDKGEEILAKLREFAEKENVSFARVSAIGAVGSFTAGVFDTTTKRYRANEFEGNFEIVSLTGTVDRMNGAFYAHLHMSAGNEYGKVTGGHLNEAYVSATCEIVVRVVEGSVGRAFSDEIGLNLFEF